MVPTLVGALNSRSSRARMDYPQFEAKTGESPNAIGASTDSLSFLSSQSISSSGTSSSEYIASTGHSETHALQSIHSSGSITKYVSSSLNASTGQTATQSWYLCPTQAEVTTYVIFSPVCDCGVTLCDRLRLRVRRPISTPPFLATGLPASAHATVCGANHRHRGRKTT